MYEDLCLYIDGQFLKGDGRKEQDIVNPATDEVIGKLPHATKEDLDRALAAAQRAFLTWRRSSPMERSKILRKVGELSRARAKEIGANITLDMGKPLAEAVAEVTVCSEHADWAAEESRRIYGRVIAPRTEGVRRQRIVRTSGWGESAIALSPDRKAVVHLRDAAAGLFCAAQRPHPT